MHRNRFLGDLLANLFDRRNAVRGRDDPRGIDALCRALLSAEGKVSGLRLASTILARWGAMDPAARLAFFRLIFVEVALADTIPGAIDELLADDRTPLAEDSARVTLFDKAAFPSMRSITRVPLSTRLILPRPCAKHG